MKIFYSIFIHTFAAGWATIWRGLWAMLMRGFSAVCVETCWSAPCRRPVNTPIAAPASVAGWSITAPVLRTGCHWISAASNLYTGLSTSLSMCIYTWNSYNFFLLVNFQQVCSSNAVIDRYMRNDLTRLQIRCVNAAQGCEVVCSLENLNAHEDECEFAFVSCSNTGTNPLPLCNN